MSIVKTIQEKINHLKEEKMYVGIQFEKQLNERVKELERLEQEIDKVLEAK